MRQIDTVFIHCSATRPDWWAAAPLRAKIAEIRRWHVEQRGFRDIGYHYLIDRNGARGNGRPVEQIGAHVKGHNAHSIGVCLIGGHGAAATDQFQDHFTAAQDAALRDLLADLLDQFPGARIRGHNQVAAKGCPGFDVTAWLARGNVAQEHPDAPWWAHLWAAIRRLLP
jgi:hypothetical protein